MILTGHVINNTTPILTGHIMNETTFITVSLAAITNTYSTFSLKHKKDILHFSHQEHQWSTYIYIIVDTMLMPSQGH